MKINKANIVSNKEYFMLLVLDYFFENKLKRLKSFNEYSQIEKVLKVLKQIIKEDQKETENKETLNTITFSNNNNNNILSKCFAKSIDELKLDILASNSRNFNFN